MKSIKIIGTGSAIPERVLTNKDLEAMVDTSDRWIFERTGIKERRIAPENVASSDLGAEALARACKQAGIGASDLDVLIVGTSTTDTIFPSTACWMQEKLGIRGMPAFDVSAGCSAFLYALEIAASFIASGTGRRVGVVGAEVMSKVTDWNDRNTCVLFGDGAGAAVVTAGEGPSGILSSNWGSDGNLAAILCVPAGGTRMPTSQQTLDERLHTVSMEGNKVFKHAVTAMSRSALDAMKEADLGPDDIDVLIPHQANLRIMEATRERTRIPRDRVVSILEKYGNTSAASIPMAIDEARDSGVIRDGSVILMAAFGTGFTWASTIVRW